MLRHREQLDAEVAVVAFAEPVMLRAYRDGLPELAGAALFSDPTRAAYAAFGFGRASFARVWLDPRVWARYAALLARGRRPGPPQGDAQQLGGDVLAVEGRAAWVYASAGPEDRPTLTEVLTARRRGAPGPGRRGRRGTP